MFFKMDLLWKEITRVNTDYLSWCEQLSVTNIFTTRLTQKLKNMSLLTMGIVKTLKTSSGKQQVSF